MVMKIKMNFKKINRNYFHFYDVLRIEKLELDFIVSYLDRCEILSNFEGIPKLIKKYYEGKMKIDSNYEPHTNFCYKLSLDQIEKLFTLCQPLLKNNDSFIDM